MSKISHIKRVETRFVEERERVLRGLACLDDVNAMNPQSDWSCSAATSRSWAPKASWSRRGERKFGASELLASQAAISLENAVSCSDLLPEYADRKRAEEGLRRTRPIWLRPSDSVKRAVLLGIRPAEKSTGQTKPSGSSSSTGRPRLPWN